MINRGSLRAFCSLSRRIQSPIVRTIGKTHLRLLSGEPLPFLAFGEIPKKDSDHAEATSEVAREPSEELREADGVPRTVDNDFHADKVPGSYVEL